jgi:hypothetical protein
MERLSKPLFVSLIFGPQALCLLLLGLAVLSGSALGTAGLVAVLVAAGLCWLAGVVATLVLVHRLWSAIQGGVARTSPGEAVGLLFLPIFNLYWIFQVYFGWAVDFNRSAARAHLRSPRMNEGVALTMCCLALFLPVLGAALGALPLPEAVGLGLVLLLSLLPLALFAAFVATACDCVNALSERADALGRAGIGVGVGAVLCNICGATLRGAERFAGLCAWCQRRAG